MYYSLVVRNAYLLGVPDRLHYIYFGGNNMKYVDLTEHDMLQTVGGKNWVRCYAGTFGSAFVGAAGGPLGYLGGAMVVYASFC